MAASDCPPETDRPPETERRPAPRWVRLRRRREFLATAKGVRVGRTAFLLQARTRPEPPAAAREPRDGQAAMGVGITVTRKIGNAVTRNRARRRLRAALAGVLRERVFAGLDMVVVARPAALSQAFGALADDLRGAMTLAARRAAAP